MSYNRKFNLPFVANNTMGERSVLFVFYIFCSCIYFLLLLFKSLSRVTFFFSHGATSGCPEINS